MADQIETIAGSVVQHGHHNDRIYVMHLEPRLSERLIPALDSLAMKNGYGKIVAKVPAPQWEPFSLAGYSLEAVVPGFFEGMTDGLFIAKFFSTERQKAARQKWRDRIGGVSINAAQAGETSPPIIACTPNDAEALARIYGNVFESYAFPIHRPDFLCRMMRKNAFYFCIRVNHSVAAVAAAEIDFENNNCEMTDFATLPKYRGQGLAGKLLRRLDKEARIRDVKTAYTIARADSHAMNRVFQKRGYRYAGRLINNTQIDGRIRSMNVWYKRLKQT